MKVRLKAGAGILASVISPHLDSMNMFHHMTVTVTMRSGAIRVNLQKCIFF